MIKICKNNNIFLFFTLLLISCFNKKSISYEITEKVYGEFGLSFGYSFQGYSGELLKQYNKHKKLDNYNADYFCHNLGFGISNRFYYKFNNFVHSFVGLGITKFIVLLDQYMIKKIKVFHYLVITNFLQY